MRQRFCIIVNLLVIVCIIWLIITSWGDNNRFYLLLCLFCVHVGAIFAFYAHTIGVLRFSGVLDKHKPAKYSVEEEVEYMVGCVRRAEEVLNSKESNRLGFHNKRPLNLMSALPASKQRKSAIFLTGLLMSTLFKQKRKTSMSKKLSIEKIPPSQNPEN